MFGIKKIEIAENERGLLFQKKSFDRVLGPGTHRFLGLPGKLKVEIFDVTQLEFEHPLAEFLVLKHPKLADDVFHVVETGDTQAGFLYVDDKLTDLIQPASRRIFWRGVHDVRVELQDIEEEFEIPREKVPLLGHLRSPQSRGRLVESVQAAEVADNHVGLLSVNGKLESVLGPGSHAFWKLNRSVIVRLLDCRLQSMEVSGQEILTKDKVSLRINLAATYRVAAPEVTCTTLSDFAEFLYKELQFGLREAVGTEPLDELLSNKDVLNAMVESYVKERAAAYGIDVVSVGVKDIILPGEMKTLLGQVVEAEKLAQANLIRRREETAATRSLANTAKMMESNPTLLRLKELEALEKVTERIDKITVFGGLNGVLKDLVTIGDR